MSKAAVTNESRVIEPADDDQKEAEYWVPTDPMHQRRLVSLLAQMVQHYLETHLEESENDADDLKTGPGSGQQSREET